MKKKLPQYTELILLLSIIFSNTLFAQKIRFDDSSNIWHSSWWSYSQGATMVNLGDYNFAYQDTLITIAGKSYKLLNADATISLLVREDTLAGKVFIKSTNGQLFTCDITDTNEFVYYDYNLQVGDTLTMPVVSQTLNFSVLQSKHVVNSIDSININGLWHRQLKMLVISGFQYPTSYKLTEGVGNNQMPIIIPSGPGMSDIRLECFKNKGTNPIPGYSKCTSTSIVPIFNDDDLVLYPNPANNQLNIEYKGQPISYITMRISDILGRSHFERSFKNTININLSNYAPGLYVLQFLSDNEVFLTRKFIVHHQCQ